MTDAFVSVNGTRAQSVRFVGPWLGVWEARVSFDGLVAIPTGPVALKIGALTLSGIVDAGRSGDYALSSSWTIIGGRGGWRTVVAAKALHNDGNVTRKTVVTDVAASIGETVEILDATLATSAVGVDFVRSAGEASRVLEQIFPSVPWWIAADGSTKVGARPTRDVTGRVELLDANPILGLAVLVADDPTDLLPGCSFTDTRLPGGPFLIHDVELVVDGGKARATAWSSQQRDARLAGLVTQLARRAFPKQIYAYPYRYRVVTLTGDRVNLQYVPKPGAIKPLALPDVLVIGIAPGMAGLSAQLELGSLVLVEFVEGDAGDAIITHFTRKNEPGFLPVACAIDASSRVDVGLSAARVHVGDQESSNPATAAGRFVRWGDTAVGPVAFGQPLTLVPHVTNTTMSKAGT